jgi:putative membrane protein
MFPFGGGLFMLLVLVLAFVLAGRFLRRSSGASATPLDILKKRYAQGGISREEFERMKQEIKN